MARTNGKSKRQFTVNEGCEFDGAYHRPGELVDDVPAKLAEVWVAEGVLIPEGETLAEGVIPVTSLCEVTVVTPGQEA